MIFNQRTDSSKIERISYLRLRKAIGVLAGFLPLTFITASLLSGPNYLTLQVSFSAYYYTNLRDVFTCSLSVLALFLITYKGFGSSVWWKFWKNDNFLSNLAGIAFLLVALFPTNPTHGKIKIYSLIPTDLPFLSQMHNYLAVIAFTCLAIISIFVFTIGQQENKKIPIHFLNENYLYIVCGSLMVLSFVVLLPLIRHWHVKQAMLISETCAFISFSISWLVKGRALGSNGRIGRILYREDNP
ncbi:hypothetical protein [Flavobacterium sp. CFS9]|uniref:hypothetical protein n=1 Tax=Flavobacterium sp. CFS9 TaxID=3143118 RepID=UPI0034E8427C